MKCVIKEKNRYEEKKNDDKEQVERKKKRAREIQEEGEKEG